MGGISIWEVVDAAATKPFGFMPFYPGPGLGGHCIPIDPYYLSWLARRYDFETNFITLSARVNETMPFYVVDAVIRAIAQQPVRMKEAKVLILGVAFKRDVSDTRHSPATRIIELLHHKGIHQISYSDPHVPSITVEGDQCYLELESIDVNEQTLQDHDVVVIVTDHSAFPYSMIAKYSKTVVDTRNAMHHIPHDRDKVMLLGGGDF
jgi:UDP-N-acetyl-D-glucosamine dehydrogenase